MKLISKALLFCILGILLYSSYIFFQILWYKYYPPRVTAFMQAEISRLSDKNPQFKLKKHWIAYPSISVYAKQAVIASEDANFTIHDGVDWDALEKAAKENATLGRKKRGGSTISMQLSRNLFLSSNKSYLRKIEEVYITQILELTLDKKRILELYLNIAEWGIGVFGIEAAANHYFGVSASKLTPYQAAWLASILPAPRRFDLMRSSPYLEGRALTIMARMPQAILPR